MKKLKLITRIVTYLTVCIKIGFASDAYLPSHILMMDQKFSHHVILVEKATHKLHLYENKNSVPKLIKSFNTATGKFKGNKSVNGDHKTPEGIYTIYEFLSKEELYKRHGKYADIYGSGAFPMNYPNLIDTREGKGGGGIWLHSTDDDSRIYKGLDSRGCVVVQNQDLKEISQYIDLNHTPIIVVQDIYHLSQSTWERNRKDIHETIQKWGKAWQEKDFETYISSYDTEKFKDNKHGNYYGFKSYKKAVFSRDDQPQIKLDFTSIFSSENYAIVYLQQDYKSAIINDIGKKTLYLQKNQNYEWKIVGEVWNRVDGNVLAFTPSRRFFKD